MLSQKLLRCPPVVDHLSDAVTDKKCSFGRMGRSHKGTIYRVRSSLDTMARHSHTFNFLHAAKTSNEFVAQEEDTGDERDGNREDEILHGSNPKWHLVDK